MRRGLLVGTLLIAALGVACDDDGGGSSTTTDTSGTDTGGQTGAGFTLESSAFEDGGDIPDEFTCNGDDTSPPLEWSGASQMAIGYALVMEDLDANGFVHWVLFDIPGDTTSLAAGDDGGGTVGSNQLGTQRYIGPCPPSGNHEYQFTLYSLFEPLDLGPEATAEDVKNAARGAPSTQLSGFYAAPPTTAGT
ncbi:MAG: YbhB/YbcL family Raf kinase inhibitor-like protein [Acidimicrobiia bacterium]